MNFYLISTLAFIFILGAAVVIHEFGHFIVAKLLGIRVETFSVGFGKRLFGRRWGTTDYRLSLIPLGGYVKLGGDESNAGIEGESAADIPVGERFDLRPRWQKFLVAVAGPVMNILTAIAVPFVGAMATGVPIAPSLVVKSVSQGGAAEVAGIRQGDRIVSFNGRENREWDKIRNDALISPEQPLPIVVERDGQQIPLTVTPKKRVDGGEAIGELGFQPDFGNIPVIVDSVTDNSPASEAGLKPGDRILTVGGEPVSSDEQVVQYIRDHKGEPIRLNIGRGGENLEIVATTRLIDGVDRLGFAPREDYPLERAGLFGALGYAVDRNIEFIRLTGVALGQVFSGRRSMSDTFSGPIGIAKASSRAATEGGWEGVFGMLAFLSLNLGIFNLLPIPVLDGGMIMMLFIEGTLAGVGLKLSMAMRERIQQVGFVFLLLLMGFVIVNDITKTASEWSRRPAASETQQK
ncbi:MAG: RIP metalloprotease RseP [Acidobacteriota bacterium]|nr:RIP metalloprotease RseP [Acidobacteriota bacterium]